MFLFGPQKVKWKSMLNRHYLCLVYVGVSGHVEMPLHICLRLSKVSKFAYKKYAFS